MLVQFDVYLPVVRRKLKNAGIDPPTSASEGLGFRDFALKPPNPKP